MNSSEWQIVVVTAAARLERKEAFVVAVAIVVVLVVIIVGTVIGVVLYYITDMVAVTDFSD